MVKVGVVERPFLKEKEGVEGAESKSFGTLVCSVDGLFLQDGVGLQFKLIMSYKTKTPRSLAKSPREIRIECFREASIDGRYSSFGKNSFALPYHVVAQDPAILGQVCCLEARQNKGSSSHTPQGRGLVLRIHVRSPGLFARIMPNQAPLSTK